MRLCIAFLILLLARPGAASAQQNALVLDGSPAAAARLHALALSDSAGHAALLYWRASRRGGPASDGAGLRVAPSAAWIRVEGNSGYPVDRSNGLLWGGRGLGTLLSAGVEARIGAVSAAFRPEIAYNQNLDFTMRPAPPNDPFGNPYYGRSIDLPQRFGEDAFSAVGPGQSYVRADVGPVGAGVSTETLWWGPGLRESILLGNSAGGFPHAFVETTRGLDVWIGNLSGTMFWGQLHESEHYDAIDGNERSLLTGVSLVLQPRGLQNLYLGAARTYMIQWDDVEVSRLLPFFEPLLKESLGTPDNPQGNDPDDQRLSVFFRWVLPESGFEAYGEMAREDHSWDWKDLAQEPDHSAAYLVGVQHVRPLQSTRHLRIQAEWVNLQQVRESVRDRSTPRLYVHTPHGHTHRGQILGAGIGPGAESQFVGIDVIGGASMLGGFVERVRRNEMSGVARAARETWPLEHDVELTAGTRGMRAFGGIQATGQLSYSYRLNRDWIEDASNWRLLLQASWSPGRTGGWTGDGGPAARDATPGGAP